jgi:DNA adenine methylase
MRTLSTLTKLTEDKMQNLTVLDTIETIAAKPILKWVGGKTQILNEIIPKIPKKYEHYVEPFFGGGALFFALRPSNSIIADSNPELINLYRSIATDVENVIQTLKYHKNTKEHFYTIRKQEWEKLPTYEAAARTIYLNKTCFNGLYRVNAKGQFNVPFGNYRNPNFLDEYALIAASNLLRKSTIICGDYKDVLKEYAKPGDFIFLDPPYLPVSEYADFKRYTKEQFYEDDHIELASEVQRLHELGCFVILTNSNHPIVYEHYKKFSIEVLNTKRSISCNGNNRKGEDVIVSVQPRVRLNITSVKAVLPEQVLKYPPTRYMGSKHKLLSDIWGIACQFKFENVIDLFSGSGVVGYMFKSYGKTVICNDYMMMSHTVSKALIENNKILLSYDETLKLLQEREPIDHFVEKSFQGLYFSDYENRLIDIIRSNIKTIKNPYKWAIAMSALIRACMKKRPRGIFSYIGQRYDDGRCDIKMSLRDQFLKAVDKINAAVFDNGKKNKSRNGDAMTMQEIDSGLVYIDPPYYSPLSDNEYVRRYHFVEGLARDWEGIEIQNHTITKKFKSYPTPFSSRNGSKEAFDALFKHFRNSILLVSYSSNSLPTLNELVALIAKHKSHVDVLRINHKYSFGNQSNKVENNKNKVQEYLFIGY